MVGERKLVGQSHVIPVKTLVRQVPGRQIGEISCDQQQDDRQESRAGRGQRTHQKVHAQAPEHEKRRPCVLEIDGEQGDVAKPVYHGEDQLRIVRVVQLAAGVVGRGRRYRVRRFGRDGGVVRQVERIVVAMHGNLIRVDIEAMRKHHGAGANGQRDERRRTRACRERPGISGRRGGVVRPAPSPLRQRENGEPHRNIRERSKPTQSPKHVDQHGAGRHTRAQYHDQASGKIERSRQPERGGGARPEGKREKVDDKANRHEGIIAR